MIDLWSPPSGLAPAAILLTAVLLGIVHGITPDEHTWPITFSYSIGSYSAEGGLKAGLNFSLAFTLQRALASQLAALSLIGFLRDPSFNAYVYLIVGSVMALSGFWMWRGRAVLHLFHQHPLSGEQPRAPSATMPWLHGFVAGWGVGAFALITYSVLAPAMPSVWLGWAPGACFGLGTTLVQAIFGGLFGRWMSKRRLSERARSYVARAVASRVLRWGGSAFVAAGLVGVADPAAMRWGLPTGIRVHNLHSLGIGFLLAVIVLFTSAAYAFTLSLREARARFVLEGPVGEG
jgi:hypothetical protein